MTNDEGGRRRRAFPVHSPFAFPYSPFVQWTIFIEEMTNVFRGVLALLGRSLRIDARSWQVHLARVGLMACIYISLAFVFATSARFGAPGLHFFRAIVWLNVCFMTLLGIGFFSTVITEEKEEDTLGLMQMAGISPLRILLGKVGGRLCQALLLIAVQYPFTLLAVTMGGVTPNQVRCAFVGLTTFMVLLAGLGLLCSTIAPRSRSASGGMVAGLLVYMFVPYASWELANFLVSRGFLNATSAWAGLLRETGSTCLFLQINTIMTSNFGDAPWSSQAISNVLGGPVCFLLAWALFPLCTRNPATESASRGMLSRRKGKRSFFSPGRPWGNPYLWKDFHFVGGGVGMVLVRLAFYAAVLVISILLSEYWWGGMRWQGQYPFQFGIGLYQALSLFILSIESALLASRTLHDEIRGQTIASLVMLPESLNKVVYSKLLGTLLAGFPGAGCLAAVCLFTPAGRYHTSGFLEEAAGWFFLSHFVLVPHLAMALALYMRWGCVPLAIGISIGSVVGWVCVFESVRIGRNGGVVYLAAMIMLAASIGSHVWIAFQLPKVAAR
jgi:ABC-type transport system involved in multi-copper enzyme maturation permease subunit